MNKTVSVLLKGAAQIIPLSQFNNRKPWLALLAALILTIVPMQASFADPDIQATKEDAPGGTASPGDTITYTNTITNTGDMDATDVTMEPQRPEQQRTLTLTRERRLNAPSLTP